MASFKHAGDVSSIAFSPDGKTLAVAGFGNESCLKIWGIGDRKEVDGYRGHSLWVESVAFSPDGKVLASAGADQVRLWDVGTGKERAVLPHKLTVMSVAFSPDSRILATADGNSFDVRYGSKVFLWDVSSAKETVTLSGHKSLIYCVAFSSDGKLLATVSLDGTVRLWDSKTGKEEASMKGYGMSVVFSSDGRFLAYPISGGVKLREVATGKEGEPLQTGADTVRAITFSPDSKTVLAASYDNERRSIQLWDAVSGKELVHVKGDPKAMGFPNLALSPDGKSLATSQASSVKLWDTTKMLKVPPTK